MNNYNRNNNFSREGRELSYSEKSKKRTKKIKIVLISFLLAVVILAAGAFVMALPLIQAYRKSQQNIEYIPPEEYTHSAMPDIVTLSGEDPYIDDATDVGTENTKPDETTLPETEPETEPDVYVDPDIYKPVIENGIYKVDKIDKDIENILVLGTDTESYSGRTDTMMIVSFNRRTKEVKLLSLLRDMYVPIKGHNWQRLNTAHSFGGVSLCINTINNLYGLDIQKFVRVNFNGTRQIIDVCGGLDIDLTDTIYNYLVTIGAGYNISKNDDGTYHLGGDAGLEYLRIRSGKDLATNETNDFRRTERQRKAVMILYRNIVTSRNPTQIYNLIKEGFKLINTNIGLSDMLDLATDVVSIGADLNIASENLPQKGNWQYAAVNIKSYKPDGTPKVYDSVIQVELDKEKAFVQRYIYG